MARAYSTTMDPGLLEDSRDYANDSGRFECVALVQKIRLKNLASRDVNDAQWYFIVEA